MNKPFSPGRIYKIKGVIVRAKRQFSCEGCLFDNFFGCPRIKDSKKSVNKDSITCVEDGVIFISPKK